MLSMTRTLQSASAALVLSSIMSSVQATEVVLELDIDWQAPSYGGSITSADWGGLNTSQDTWLVQLNIEEFDLSSGPIVAAEASGLFAADIQSTTALPIGLAPADDHIAQDSFDAALKQRYDFDIEQNGAVILEDVVRGVRDDVTPGYWWRFDRELGQILPAGRSIDSATIIQALAQPGREIAVTERFQKTAVASYIKTGVATISSVTVDGIAVEVQTSSAPASCRFQLATQWPGGYVAYVYLKNESVEAINGWNVNINFADNVDIVHSWATNLSGAAPSFSAGNLSWNQVIEPGQEINFGFQGSAAPGQEIAASVSGSICK